MSTEPEQPPSLRSIPDSSERPSRPTSWLQLHFPIILYGWFWLGLLLCTLFAPDERVRALKSDLITEGWHLSVLSLIFGGGVLGAYWVRLRGQGEAHRRVSSDRVSGPMSE
jgi:hypothetical protein